MINSHCAVCAESLVHCRLPSLLLSFFHHLLSTLRGMMLAVYPHSCIPLKDLYPLLIMRNGDGIALSD